MIKSEDVMELMDTVPMKNIYVDTHTDSCTHSPRFTGPGEEDLT